MTSIGMQNGDGPTASETENAGVRAYARAADIAALEAECATLRRQRDDLQAANTRLNVAVDAWRNSATEAKRLAHEAEVQRDEARFAHGEGEAMLAVLRDTILGVRDAIGAKPCDSVVEEVKRVVAERDAAARTRDAVRDIVGAKDDEATFDAVRAVVHERNDWRKRADAAERLAHEAEAQREAAVRGHEHYRAISDYQAEVNAEVRKVLGATDDEGAIPAARRVMAERNLLCRRIDKAWEHAAKAHDSTAALAVLAAADEEAHKDCDGNAAPLNIGTIDLGRAPLDVPVCRVGAHTLSLPVYAKPGDAGMDLRTPRDVVVPHGLRKRIPCGFAFAIPEGYEGQVRPKSGLSEKCIDVALGTIDSCYRGEVEALVVNNGVGPMTFKAGDKIAQIVFCPVARATLREVDALDETERGASGFGSTGAR